MTTSLISYINSLLSQAFSIYPYSFMIVLLAIIGSCIGSYLNVIIYRSPQLAINNELDYLEKNYNIKRENNTKVNRKRSYCPRCGEVVSAKYNIPIVGWMILKGQTKCCHRQLSIQYPVIESITAILFALIYARQEVIDLSLLFQLITISVAIVICAIDINHKIILDFHSSIYVASTIVLIYLLTASADFIITGIFITLFFSLLLKSYESIRNAIMKSNLVMMGDGDWALQLVLFCSVAAMSESHNLMTNITVAFLLCALLGFVTLLVNLSKQKNINKKDILGSFPAAPAIIITSMGFVFSNFFS